MRFTFDRLLLIHPIISDDFDLEFWLDILYMTQACNTVVEY